MTIGEKGSGSTDSHEKEKQAWQTWLIPRTGRNIDKQFHVVKNE